ncbi:MAG: hypothetical protein KBT67_01955 [bacterium]|nr:hypothetical protein [Candidatus Limimorpha caballi]MCQ2315247.1 hypothetical protein [Bacteroidales bacterium]
MESDTSFIVAALKCQVPIDIVKCPVPICCLTKRSQEACDLLTFNL